MRLDHRRSRRHPGIRRIRAQAQRPNTPTAPDTPSKPHFVVTCVVIRSNLRTRVRTACHLAAVCRAGLVRPYVRHPATICEAASVSFVIPQRSGGICFPSARHETHRRTQSTSTSSSPKHGPPPAAYCALPTSHFHFHFLLPTSYFLLPSDPPAPGSAHSSRPSPQPRRTSPPHTAKPATQEPQAGTRAVSHHQASDTQSGPR